MPKKAEVKSKHDPRVPPSPFLPLSGQFKTLAPGQRERFWDAMQTGYVMPDICDCELEEIWRMRCILTEHPLVYIREKRGGSFRVMFDCRLAWRKFTPEGAQRALKAAGKFRSVRRISPRQEIVDFRIVGLENARALAAELLVIFKEYSERWDREKEPRTDPVDMDNDNYWHFRKS